MLLTPGVAVRYVNSLTGVTQGYVTTPVLSSAASTPCLSRAASPCVSATPSPRGVSPARTVVAGTVQQARACSPQHVVIQPSSPPGRMQVRVMSPQRVCMTMPLQGTQPVPVVCQPVPPQLSEELLQQQLQPICQEEEQPMESDIQRPPGDVGPTNGGGPDSELQKPQTPSLPFTREGRTSTSPTSRRRSQSPPQRRSESPPQPGAQKVLTNGWGTLERTFQAFCGSRPDMDGKSFAKLCKDCGLLGPGLTSTDVDIVFATVVPKGQRRINLHQFDEAMYLIAEKKDLHVNEVCRLVRRSEGPVRNATKTDAVRFHDDKSTYTGTHAQGGADRGGLDPVNKVWGRPRGRDVSLEATDAPFPQPRRASTQEWDLGCLVQVTPPPDSDTNSTPAGGGSSPALTPTPGCTTPDKITTPSHSPSPSLSRPPAANGIIEDTFRAYCWGKSDMDGKNFAKLCKDCHLVDSSLSTTDVDVLFAKVVLRGQRRIGLNQFMAAMKLLAEKKGVEMELVSRAVAASHGPVLNSTKADAVRFHDDKTRYTGVHREGGPDAGSKSASVEERRSKDWFNSLRSESDAADCLPDMILRRLGDREASESRSIPRSVSPMPDKPHEVIQRRKGRMLSMKNRAPKASEEVTMVFTDVQGSTNLWEANPAAMEQALRLHDAKIREVLAANNGYEVTTEGDAFQMAFHEPLDAISFCLEVQTELVKVEWPAATLGHSEGCISDDGAWAGLRVRMGVHSGRPAAVTKHEVTGRWRYAGPSVALAKAVEDVCHGGQILLSAACFQLIDGALTQLGSPQVIDLGEHLLKGHGLGNGEALGQEGTITTRLFQLVPAHLAVDSDAITPDGRAKATGGRTFAIPSSVRRISPGFHESPSGTSITLCFVFTKGAQDLVTSCPELASTVLGMLRRCVRSLLQTAGNEGGYECQEDEGAFMLAFHTMQSATAFAVMLQQELPHLPWPEELRTLSPAFSEGLKVAIGALSGGYTSRRPHTSTGRADYFGTIVNRTARIAAAAHGGQVLLGGDLPAALHDSVESDTGMQLERLGAFQLKGIDGPMVLHELRVADGDGEFENFPEPKTKGRMGN